MGTMRRSITAGLVAIATVLGCPLARAATIAGDPVYAGSAALAKVSRVLLERRQRAATAGAAPGFRMSNGLPELDIRLSALTPELVEQIRDSGLRILDADYRSARILGTCADCLAALAEISQVTAVHPNYGARTMTGNVTSQADVSIRAAEARATYGLSGAGVSIGLISDTFSDRTSGDFSGSGCDRMFTSTVATAAAEIPTVHLLAEPSDFTGGDSFRGIDEGRAMAELVYDLAPGADLYFHTAFTTPSIFARGIDALADCGVNIIADDVIYFAEPMFQDGIVAQAAGRAAERDILFFSAIGNLGTWGVDEHYRDFSDIDDTASPPSGVDFHVFGNGSRFARIDLPPGCGLRMVLQWNEPFSGTLGSGAKSDLDLYACPSDNLLAPCDRGNGGRDSQGCSRAGGGPGGDPLEIMDIPSGTRRRTVFIAVDHVCGDEDLRFRIVNFSLGCIFPGGFEFDEEVFDQSQTYGHPAGPGVVSTAAVFYQEIDSDGATHAPDGVVNVEPFSSRGGDIPYYFDDHGKRLPAAPLLRTTPHLAGPDGANTSFFGGNDIDNDGFRNFFGTSAAAPHAAAVAALILEADPDLSAQQTLSILQSTSIDIGVPGFDTLSGSGLIDAVDAIEEAFARRTASPTPTASTTPTASATPTASFTPTASATPTASTTPTASHTATRAALPPCPGDCNSDDRVTVAELVTSVRINLNSSGLETCPAIDIDGDGEVRINELIRAVTANLAGC